MHFYKIEFNKQFLNAVLKYKFAYYLRMYGVICNYLNLKVSYTIVAIYTYVYTYVFRYVADK